MAQSSFPFENVDTTETQFSQMFRTLNAGVNGTPAGTELKVSAGTGLQVSVAAGQAMVRGHYYISTAAELLTIGTANASNPRIDSVVLRLDPVANSIVLAVVAGTAAASPVAPTLTQTDAGVFEYLLGTVLVPAGSGTLSTITDTRTFMGSRLGIWATATRPVSPYVGQAGFNSTLGIPEWWNGSLWRAFVTAQEVADQSPRGNAIINGDFGINQRNVTSTNNTNGGFVHDRWRCWGSPTGGANVYSTQAFTPGAAPVAGYEGANYARLVTSGQSASTDYMQLAQAIEDVRTFAGQTITVSFWAKAASGTPQVALEMSQYFGSGGSPSSQVLTYGGKVTLSTVWARYSLTVAMPSISGKTLGSNANDSVGVGFWVSAGSNFNARSGSIGIQNNTFDFWGVQAEVGSVASPFRTSTGTKQGELAACQRYYIRYTGDGTFFTGMVPFSNSGALMSIHFPVIMRAKPSTTLEWNGVLADYGVANHNYYNASALTVDNAEVNRVVVRVDTNANYTVGQVYQLAFYGQTSYLGFSAEL